MDNNYQSAPIPGANTENQPYSHSANTPLQGNQIIPKDALATQKNRSILWIIITIISSLTAVTFIILFVWMYNKWNTADTNVTGQIEAAAAVARSEAIAETEKTFEEREKIPYRTFSGPSDLGSLTFDYPKTWDLYTEEDGADGRELKAYLNPSGVPPLDNENPIALRVQILSESFDSYIQNYQSEVEDGKMSLTVAPVGGANANIYKGELENDFQGFAAIFKIRDKTVVLQTDSLLFEADFNNILASVKYNL